MTRKARYFWPFLLLLFVTDCTTKQIAVDYLEPGRTTGALLDSIVRFTLIHNPGAAFSFDAGGALGAWTRPALIVLMLGLLSILLRIYWISEPRARAMAIGLGLACGGAIGNIVDRFRYPAGVVDFIDVGVGAHRFFVCNVADIGVSIGGVLLAIAILRAGNPRAHRPFG